MGIMQAIISVFLDDGDKIRCINAGNTRITFLLWPPLYYVCASSWGEPESVVSKSNSRPSFADIREERQDHILNIYIYKFWAWSQPLSCGGYSNIGPTSIYDGCSMVCIQLWLPASTYDRFEQAPRPLWTPYCLDLNSTLRWAHRHYDVWGLMPLYALGQLKRSHQRPRWKLAIFRMRMIPFNSPVPKSGRSIYYSYCSRKCHNTRSTKETFNTPCGWVTSIYCMLM